MKPLISIIIPSYNKADYIQETLDSIKDQDFTAWEAIVVDDGSTDNSVAIIKENCIKDTRIKLLIRQEEPKGGSTCRNIGIEHALGKFIIFLDADDILTSQCLSNRLANIDDDASSDFWVFSMGTFYKIIGDCANVWKPKKGNHLKMFLSHNLPWTITSPIWKKSFLLSIGAFDTSFLRLQDVEMHTRALLQSTVNYKIIDQKNPDCFYRISENRIIDNMDTFLKKWIAGAVSYIEKMGKLIEKNQLNSKDLRNKLKGTAFTTLTNLMHRKYLGQINLMTYKSLRDQLMLSKGVEKVFNSGDYHKVRIYEQLYTIGLHKIKGFNYTAKLIFQL